MPLVATRGAASAQGFGEFGAVAAPIYIEDVFSTYLYTGNGSTQTITNGIDLSGKGGLVWTKSRSGAQGHIQVDTVRGANNILQSNTANGQINTPSITAFNPNGFSLSSNDTNQSGITYASWTFREQAKFFDVVTYTGNGANRTIAHNLGSVPGCIIVKRTDTVADWQVYHRSLANTEYMVLNSTATKTTGATRWNSTTPTSTVFSVGTDTTVNASGGTYVAYLFAHDAGGFGLAGTDNVISCGSYSGNSSNPPTITLGWEPQLILIKLAQYTFSPDTGNWNIFDNMRGLPVGGPYNSLAANNSAVEQNFGDGPVITPTGFRLSGNNFQTNTSDGSPATYIYIAIRRGPMQVPTSGTSVFTPVARTGTGADATVTAGFPVDMAMTAQRTNVGATNRFGVVSRLIGAPYLITWLTSAETSDAAWYQTNPFDNQTALKIGNGAGSSGTNNNANTYVNHLFRRAPGFFDVVCDTGTGVARNITHNLGAVPELMIRKKRSSADNWIVYANNDNTDYLSLNSNAATVDDNTMWNDTSPTSSVFTVGTNSSVNGSGPTYVTYLFSTVPGVSKVGSYTGNGTSQTINCGFTTGARYILIKKISGTGDWYVWDSARGIVAGDDPNLQLNTNNPESGVPEDVVDTASAGFIVNNTGGSFLVNDNGATYIFLAIA